MDLGRKQHPVTENVSRHITDTHHAKGLFLDVLAHFAEVSFDPLPGATCSDGHGLVVVTNRTTGRECITHPETTLQGNLIGCIGKRCSPFIGSHYQVGVVFVISNQTGCRDNFIFMYIISNIY